MMEIFLIQLLAAGLGALSTAWADWCYNRARIGGRLHAFWVSASIAAICLPVVAWVSTVFFGAGLLGQSIAGILVGAIFLWVYRNLPNQRLPFAATCSAFERVSFSGWTIVLLTAARAAPRLGNSDSMPSRCSA